MDKLDEGLKTLLDLGKRRGFLTFDQVNDYLPDEATSPERIHGLLETLDEMGIELINEDEAESRLLASGDMDDEPDDDRPMRPRKRKPSSRPKIWTRFPGGSTIRFACILPRWVKSPC